MLSIDQVGEVEEAGETLVDWDAVDQHLGVFAAQTPCENGSELSRRPGLHDRESRHLPQGIGHAFGLVDVKILRRDHASRSPGPYPPEPECGSR